MGRGAGSPAADLTLGRVDIPLSVLVAPVAHARRNRLSGSLLAATQAHRCAPNPNPNPKPYPPTLPAPHPIPSSSACALHTFRSPTHSVSRTAVGKVTTCLIVQSSPWPSSAVLTLQGATAEGEQTQQCEVRMNCYTLANSIPFITALSVMASCEPVERLIAKRYFHSHREKYCSGDQRIHLRAVANADLYSPSETADGRQAQDAAARVGITRRRVRSKPCWLSPHDPAPLRY